MLIQRSSISTEMMLFAVIFFSCNDATNGEQGEGEHGEERGEESGIQYALDDTCNEVYNGVRLIMYYDAQNKSFNGSVENTTDKILIQVRVELHLSNGVELGPTTPADLGSGEIRPVILDAANQDFEKWSAHPEVGSGEHGKSEGHSEEHGEREHDREGSGEHGEEHE